MRRYRRPDDVAQFEECAADGRTILYLGRLPDGPLIVLEGTALAIWLAAVEPVAGASDVGADVASRVAAEVGVAPDAVRDDVTAFVRQLTESGFLVETDEGTEIPEAMTPEPSGPLRDGPPLRSST